jgi:hypothetical protein
MTVQWSFVHMCRAFFALNIVYLFVISNNTFGIIILYLSTIIIAILTETIKSEQQPNKQNYSLFLTLVLII